MPGLIRGVARTAVVAGTASAVAGRVQRRQAEKFADRDAQIYADRGAAYEQGAQQAAGQAEPVQQAPAAGTDMVTQLKELAALKEQGILTEEEFATQKAKVLAG